MCHVIWASILGSISGSIWGSISGPCADARIKKVVPFQDPFRVQIPEWKEARLPSWLTIATRSVLTMLSTSMRPQVEILRLGTPRGPRNRGQKLIFQVPSRIQGKTRVEWRVFPCLRQRTTGFSRVSPFILNGFYALRKCAFPPGKTLVA